MGEQQLSPEVTDRAALTNSAVAEVASSTFGPGDAAPSDVVAARPTMTNLAQLIGRQAELIGDQPALVDPGDEVAHPRRVRRTFSWTEIDARVDAVAGGLAAYGLVAGHRVAIQGPNSIELVVAYFAVLRAGFVAVPVDPQADEAERQAILLDSGARLLLTAGPVPDAAYLPDALDVLALSVDGLRAVGDRRSGPVVSPQDAEALAVLLYTAGTSTDLAGTPSAGMPGDVRAVMLTHRSLFAHLDNVASLGILGPSTVMVGALPMVHVFGLNAVLGGWAMGGGTLVVVDGYREDLTDLVVSEHITSLTLSPSMIYRLLHDERLESCLVGVQTVISGAAALPSALSNQFTERTGLRVDQGYGLTEASPGVATTIGAELLGPGHVGRALPGVAVRIGDGSDDSEPAEIFVRGDNLFSGYWPDGRDGADADGWFSTGDIGYLRGADLFLVDRARDLIEVSGFHVFPAEVEDVMLALESITAVAVVGRLAGRGEQIVAFVVGAEGLSVDDVRAHCGAHLARFKQPQDIYLVDELPRGATGKIQKGALRRLMEDPADAAPGSGSS